MQTSERKFLVILAAALMLCFAFSACDGNVDDSPSLDDPAVSATATSSGHNTADNGSSIFEGLKDPNNPDTPLAPAGTQDGDPDATPGSGSEAKIEYQKVYAALINEWKSALNSYKLNEYTKNHTLNVYFYDNSDPASAKVYYSLFDIDSNGTMELILSKQNSYEDIIAYIFTLKDGSPTNIFGYDDNNMPIEVPWSRTGSSSILSTGLIDSMEGDWAIYRIANDGCNVIKIASIETFDYDDMASLDEAEWRYYVNGNLAEYNEYVQYLKTQGYTVGANNELAVLEWNSIE